MDHLPSWMRKKWVLFSLSAAATLLILTLIFLLFLRGPFASLFTNQGEKAVGDGDYEKAVNRYALALSLKKDREEIYTGYANAMIGLKDYNGARELLEQGIDRISGAESLYLAKARTYTVEGKIGIAADFLDSIDNSYINKKLQDIRPAALEFSPAQGSYGTAQKITLEQREGQTIYYTLNGEDPTINSQIYTESITVSSTATLTALAVDSNGLVSPRLKLTYEIDNANQAIVFTDAKIEEMVRAELGQPNGNLYAARLASVTSLSNEGIEGEIRSLKDLEYLPALQTLYIDDELLIEDYSCLGSLPALTDLTLTSCGLSDTDLASLSSCSRLTGLNISRNQITTLEPLKEMIYLEFLSAADNDIISVSALNELLLLTQLDLSGNGLTDLTDLGGLTELFSLDVSRNKISDLSPLTGLTNLTQLLLAETTPSNLKKLAELPQLTVLDVSSCALTSLSMLNDFPALQAVTANDNQIATLSTFSLDLVELYVNRNPLADLSPLEGRANLSMLEAAGTQIDDIRFLAGHPQLSVLDISNTKVTDISALQNCPQLNLVICSPECETEGLPETVSVIQTAAKTE